jgi:hypothetical protein
MFDRYTLLHHIVLHTAVEALDLECYASTGAGPSARSSELPSGSASEGFHVYLSQIKEWTLEVAADMIFIIVRTDCAWYKIRSIHPAYSGWFEPILKAARLAVYILGVITQEARSSRMSFNDVVKRVSGLGYMFPAYISSKADDVRSQLPLLLHPSV